MGTEDEATVLQLLARIQNERDDFALSVVQSWEAGGVEAVRDTLLQLIESISGFADGEWEGVESLLEGLMHRFSLTEVDRCLKACNLQPEFAQVIPALQVLGSRIAEMTRVHLRSAPSTDASNLEIDLARSELRHHAGLVRLMCIAAVNRTQHEPRKPKIEAADAADCSRKEPDELLGLPADSLAAEFLQNEFSIVDAFADWFEFYHPLTDERNCVSAGVRHSLTRLKRIGQALDIAVLREFKGEPVRSYAQFFVELLDSNSVSIEDGLSILDKPEPQTDLISDWLRRLVRSLNKFKTVLVGQLIPPPQISDAPKPRWHQTQRVLKLNGRERRFSPQTGDNVLDILNAFERQGWPEFIPNELPDPDRTRDTLRTINKNNVGLKISADGNNLYWKCTKSAPEVPV